MNPKGTPLFRASVHQATASGEACPPESVWQRVVDAAPSDPPISESSAAAYLSHASRCELCSGRLTSAIASSLDAPTAEEESFLLSMKTSSEDGQRRLAEILYEETRSQLAANAAPPPSRAKVLSWRWPLLAAAAVALIAVSGVMWWTLRKPSDDALLASAYSQHRLSELRLPGARAVAVDSVRRGAAEETTSSDLLEEKLRSQKRLEQNPNDAALRQTLGRIALTEGQGSVALRHFEMAEALNPHLPGLKFDMGSAHFELANSGNRPLDYAIAIDLFSQHLKSVNGKDAVALFDRALCWERQSVLSEAINDFDAALEIEKDAAWRAEIQTHLQALRARTAHDISWESIQQSLTPQSLLAATSEAPGQYELYVNVAGMQWLPHRVDDPETERALEKLATWGNAHDDRWLSDLLKVPASAKEMEAETSLAHALAASNSGNVDATFTAASAAILQFKALHNQAGIIRATAERIYGLQRSLRALECVTESNQLASSGALEPYAWMQIYNELNRSSCHAQIGNFTETLLEIDDAALRAQVAKLSIIRLRALGFAVESHAVHKEHAISWRIGTQALSEALLIPGANNRRYQILYGLKRVCEDLDLSWTLAGLSKAAADIAPLTGNLQTAAYAREQLALDQSRIGENADAARSFAMADGILQNIHSGPMLAHYQADWQTERAPFYARDPGRLPALLNSFRLAESDYDHVDNYASSTRYNAEYAELLRQANRVPESAGRAWTAVTFTEVALRSQHTVDLREKTVDDARAAYGILMRDLLQAGDAASALRVWEWMRSAGFRDTPGVTPSEDIRSALPALPRPTPGRTTLIYARLDDRFIAWSIDDTGTVRSHPITADVPSIAARGRALLRLCSDPTSSQTDIAFLGSSLFRDLVAPFAAEVSHASVLQLDLDPSLAAVPFPALVENGRFLGLTHPLLFLSSGWTTVNAKTREAITSQEIMPKDSHLVILRQTASSRDVGIPSSYDETLDIPSAFPQSERRAATVWRTGGSLMLDGDTQLRNALPRADVLHYTGHGLNVSDDSPAADAAAFALGPKSLPHCRLAVLAACETFRERENTSDDVPSFARILLQAGASHVLATQWDVDSRTTRDLMVRFYAELADRRSSSEALLRAQQYLQSNPTAAHPYFWSPFQIVTQ